MFHKEQILFAASMLLSRAINRLKDPRTLRYERVLFIKLDEIGDVATAMHSWQMFRKEHPHSEITLLCKPFIRGLIQHDPALNRIIHSHRQLQGEYDLIVDLRGNWNSLLYALLHPPKYRLDRATVRYKHRGFQQKEIITNFEIIEAALSAGSAPETPYIYTDQANESTALEFLKKHKLQRFAVMHPGARRVLRRWPAHQFAALADHLKSQHDLDVVFSGGREDESLIAEIMQQCKSGTYSFVNGYSLTDFAALLKHATLFVGNESGPLHIAAACDIPVIGIYGPGVPEVFYPFTENSIVLHVVLECNPCDQINCVHPDSPCITRISLAEVSAAAGELLGR